MKKKEKLASLPLPPPSSSSLAWWLGGGEGGRRGGGGGEGGGGGKGGEKEGCTTLYHCSIRKQSGPYWKQAGSNSVPTGPHSAAR